MSLASALTNQRMNATPKPLNLPPLAIVASAAVTAAGFGRAPLALALREHRSALRANAVTSRVLMTMVGEVAGLDEAAVPRALAHLDCRNHRLAAMGLQADAFAAAVGRQVQRFGAHRVGVVMGTSTSSIAASEAAYRQLDAQGQVPAQTRVPELHTLHSLGLFVQQALGLQGPSLTVSTACSSSAKAFAVAQRWLALDLVDAVVVGGVDSLCDSVLFGFHALQLVSSEACTPFGLGRRGISLGEAAGFALVTLERHAGHHSACLLGLGESSDAHHMSAPQPEGLSIEGAVRQALARSQLPPEAIDYINLHGTATVKNDAVEAAMLARVFPGTVPASSTKGCTGHTLGASGVVEAVICMLAIEQGFLPGTINTLALDVGIGAQIQLAPRPAAVRYAVSNAFGFGGTNCALVLGAAR